MWPSGSRPVATTHFATLVKPPTTNTCSPKRRFGPQRACDTVSLSVEEPGRADHLAIIDNASEGVDPTEAFSFQQRWWRSGQGLLAPSFQVFAKVCHAVAHNLSHFDKWRPLATGAPDFQCGGL